MFSESGEVLYGKLPHLARFESNVQHLVKDGYFQSGREILINRTPGRLDLMGGNDDYTGGLVFETTIREATLVAIQSREDSRVNFYNPAVKDLGWNERIEFSLADLVSAGKVKSLEEVRSWINQDERRAWCGYILGDLYYLLKEFPEQVRHGFNLYLESDIPLGKGVSSSAALEVAPMKVMGELFGIQAAGVKLAEWTQWVDIALTQSACGIMDQLTVVLGDEDHFVPMICQPCLLVTVSLLPLAFPDYEAAFFFSTTLLEQQPPLSFVDLYIPANPFHSLANSVVPVVTLFSAAIGIALIGVPGKERFLAPFDVFMQAIARVTHFVVRLTPLGVVPIAAVAAGTLSPAELTRLEVYLVTFILGALVLGLVILPLLVSALTPFRYRETWAPSAMRCSWRSSRTTCSSSCR